MTNNIPPVNQNSVPNLKPATSRHPQTKDAQINSKLPRYHSIPKQDRRRKKRRESVNRVLIELRCGQDRRKQSTSGSVDITV